jgi:SAM-dependent methyltransferase
VTFINRRRTRSTQRSPLPPAPQPREHAAGTAEWKRVCDACGSTRHELLIGELAHRYTMRGLDQLWEYRLLRCASCGLAFIDPTPEWEVMQTFYGDDYGSYLPSFAPPDEEAGSFKYRLARFRYSRHGPQRPFAVAKAALGTIAEVISGRTITYSVGVPLQLDRNARIFELGYGSGNWLLAMALLGYRNLWGYDVDANPTSEERLRSSGITTWRGIFLNLELPVGAFDCIRLEHVFEHLLSPVEVLAKCRRMLRPGGQLVLNLPCSGSWSEAISLEDHPSLELPRHLYRHTPTSARLMLERAGFEVKGLRVYAVTNHFERVINAERRRQGRRPLPSVLFRAFSPAYALASRFAGRGEHMTVLAAPARQRASGAVSIPAIG